MLTLIRRKKVCFSTTSNQHTFDVMICLTSEKFTVTFLTLVVFLYCCLSHPVTLTSHLLTQHQPFIWGSIFCSRTLVVLHYCNTQTLFISPYSFTVVFSLFHSCFYSNYIKQIISVRQKLYYIIIIYCVHNAGKMHNSCWQCKVRTDQLFHILTI